MIYNHMILNMISSHLVGDDYCCAAMEGHGLVRECNELNERWMRTAFAFTAHAKLFVFGPQNFVIYCYHTLDQGS